MADLSDMSLWLAGRAGQAGLAGTAGAAGLQAAVDQHEAEVTEALGGRITEGVLLSYARGFTDAAVGRGWWPALGDMPDGGGPDWESLRLAAVCRLFLRTRGLAV